MYTFSCLHVVYIGFSFCVSVEEKKQAQPLGPPSPYRRQLQDSFEEKEDPYFYAEPPAVQTEPPDSAYYPGPVEYYSDTEEQTPETTASSATTVTFTTAANKKEKPKVVLDDPEDELTSEAWAALPNENEMRKDRRNVTRHWKMYLDMIDNERLDKNSGITDFIKYTLLFNKKRDHLDNYWDVGLTCYQIGTTFLHGRNQLREYYRIRYAFYDKKLFEIGYVTHEIVYKYTVILELFHNVQARFYNRSRFFNGAPVSYMLYMYSNIVSVSQTVIHLCNILREIEAKYRHLDDPPEYYDEEFEAKKKQLQADKAAKGEEYAAYVDEVEAEKQRRKKRRQQQRKELAAMKKSGIFSSTRMTKRPRNYNHFPEHYGWSMEDW